MPSRLADSVKWPGKTAFAFAQRALILSLSVHYTLYATTRSRNPSLKMFRLWPRLPTAAREHNKDSEWRGAYL